MSGLDERNDTPKGFAGLGSLVSKIDAGQAEGSQSLAKSRETKAASGDVGSVSVGHTQPQRRTSEPILSGGEASNPSTAKKWLLAALCLGGVLWWLVEGTGASGKQTRPSVSSTATVSPTRPTEARPPIGDNNVLSMNQLHYCLAEDIRLDGARSALNNYSDSDVDRFNLMISDYNSRCGNFRYRNGDLERARRAVEAFRNTIVAEGRRRF